MAALAVKATSPKTRWTTSGAASPKPSSKDERKSDNAMPEGALSRGRAGSLKMRSVANQVSSGRSASGGRQSISANGEIITRMATSIKMQKMMKHKTLDDVKNRMKVASAMRTIHEEKKRYAFYLWVVSIISVLLMMIQVECRVATNIDEGAHDAMRAVGVALTLVTEALLLRYYAYHLKMLTNAAVPVTASQIVVPVLEVLILLVGVIPPGVHGYFTNPALPDQYGYEGKFEPEVDVHYDALGVLMFARVPLLIKFTVSFGIIASPAMLAWQYRVEVSPMFRFNYLMARKPFKLLFFSLITTWICGAFVLQIFEYRYASSFWTWLVTALDYVLGLGYGPLVPATLIGRITAAMLTMAGVFATALLTALITSSFELDPSELWLISQIERRAAEKGERHAAAVFVQTMARKRDWMRSHRHSGGTLQQKARRLLHHKVSVSVAARHFKKRRMEAQVSINDTVSNIKVLHGHVQGLRAMVSAKFAAMAEQHETRLSAMHEQQESRLVAMSAQQEEILTVLQQVQWKLA